MWRRLSTRDWVRLLKAHGAVEIKKRGRGSHIMLARRHADGKVYMTTVPQGRDCIKPKTSDSMRRGLKLDPDSGMTDPEFYAKL